MAFIKHNADDSISLVGVIKLDGNPIHDVAPPVAPTDAANKAFVESAVAAAINALVRRTDATGPTTGAFVQIVLQTAVKGLVGIGTIKNTGGQDMEVRESVTDAFGVTDTVVTLVMPGNDYMLDIQTDFATSLAPFVVYSVEVRHPVSATTFVLRHLAMGA